MPRLKTLYVFVAIAFVAALLLPCFTIFVVTPLYTDFVVSETEKVIENVAGQLARHLSEVPQIRTGELPQDFIREVLAAKALLGLWKVNIYSLDGEVVYSTDLKGETERSSKDFFPAIIGNGETYTFVRQEEAGKDSGKNGRIDLIETYVPIVREGRAIGVFGVHHDITASRVALNVLKSKSGSAAYLIAAILVGLIITLSVKSGRSIAQQEKTEKKLKIYSGRLEMLRKIDAAILAIQTPEAIARIAINYLTSLMSFRGVLVLAYDFDDNRSLLLAARADPGSGQEDVTSLDEVSGLDKLRKGDVFHEGSGITAIEGRRAVCKAKFPLLTGDVLVGSLDIEFEEGAEINDEEVLVIKEISGPLAIAIQNARLFASVDEHRHQLRTLATKFSGMEEAERRKIAVELHDRVGQNLTALNINLNIIKSRVRAGIIESAESCIADSFLLIEETTEQIRDIMSELRPPNLDDHGLVAAIRWYAAKQAKRSGLKIAIEGEENSPRPLLEVEMVLFRIAQEALNNIVKHAKAHSAAVKIEAVEQNIRMMITDDGIGFDVKSKSDHQGNGSGLGLVAMQERISALGGSLKIESARGRGTNIIVEV